jgi:aminopeptidase N
VIDNDIRWREILRGLNRKFRHQTVNTQQVEAYISKQAKIDLSSIFDQYLRTTQIPVLEYSISGKQVTYHYRDVIDDFSMPIKVKINDRLIRLNPTTAPQTFSDTQDITIFDIDRNFFIRPVENQTAK